ncbi:metallophosphoesterase [Sorangium sp. So ce204]|uniref:metallophosphoesterase n=1 Tax=Sorangium sp. So ce204 TaxID=3133288 RepID=UPI003F63A3C7
MLRRTVVLSDLHLGPAGPLATFRDDRALAGLLDRLGAPAEPSTEIVLAGDVFDFLQIPGYDGFRAELAADRLTTILEGPRTAPVIAALRRFAARADSGISLLAGNHDPETLLPDVRAGFEKAIGREGSVRYPDDAPLAAGLGDRWPVWGHAVGNDAGSVWIVHGDRWDPHNAVHRDALRHAVAAGRPVELPVGSQLVYRVLNTLQPENRWIPELKPELPVVFPLLLYLDPRVTLPFLQEHWGLSERLLSGFVDGRLRLGPLMGPEAGAAPPPADDVPQVLSALLAEGLLGEAPDDPGAQLADLRTHLRNGAAPAAGGMLAAHGGVGRALLRAWLIGIRGLLRWSPASLEADDGVLEPARRWLPEGLIALVAGHTHGPRRSAAGSPAYFNTGTWIPVGRLPEHEMTRSIDEIEAGRWEADAPRTWVMITCDDGPPQVALWRCDKDGTPSPVDAAPHA